MQPCYDLTGNWWISILLFTIIVKLLLMPMALWCQKNSIVMVQLMPDLNRLKVKYFGDRSTIGDKQNNLQKKWHYHPVLSLIPLIVQILILFGLVDVVHGITDNGAPGTQFLGLIPFEDGGLSWIMPVLAGLSAVVMGFAQNRINPLQKEQSTAEKNMTNGLSIALSFVLGIFVASGMAFYWVCSNLTAIGVQALCNVIIKPRTYIDYEDLEQSRVELDALNAIGKSDRKWYQRDPLAKREKADYKRFFNIVGKHLVFYSEGSGFYKYFQGAIEWLLDNSDILINYVTNDPDDQVFEIAKTQPRIRPYYIGTKRTITLMMKIDADMVVTTLEDLENYYIKRSYLRHDIEYAFMFHHMTSTHLTPQKCSYDHYDTILCVGPHQKAEIRRAEELYELPAKKLVECGYDLLDRESAAYRLLPRRAEDAAPVVLVAPSWQEGNLLDSCIDDIIASVREQGLRIIVRPHPEYVKRYRPRWDAILERYADIPSEELFFEHDFSSNETIFTSDVLVTDWSSTAFEFSFSTNKPCVFVNTSMKVGNPSWQELGIEPTDISLRDEVGVSLDLGEVSSRMGETVASLLAEQDAWHDRIEKVTEAHVYNRGHGGRVAGEYILSSLLEKQAARDDARGDGDEGDARTGQTRRGGARPGAAKHRARGVAAALPSVPAARVAAELEE